MDKTLLSAHVRTLARGPGRSRNLTFEEAKDAMSIILSGKAQPEAIGALLMLMRFRSENADEIAGFIEATHETLPSTLKDLKPDLDWPSYAAGRTRGLPFFLLSALLLSQNNIKIFMHGFNSAHSASGSTEEAINLLGLEVAETEEAVKEGLDATNFAYMPLRALSPQNFELINLRDVLGLRSPINTVLRSLNPVCAKASMIGVFHPPYIALQAQATLRMNLGDAIIFKGGSGEAERTPLKPVKMTYTRNGEEKEIIAPALLKRTEIEEPDKELRLEDLKDIWNGDIKDEKALCTIIGTAAAALFILEKADTIEGAEQMAKELWEKRPSLGEN